MYEQHHHSWDEDRLQRIQQYVRSPDGSEKYHQVQTFTCSLCNLHRRLETNTLDQTAPKPLDTAADTRLRRAKLAGSGSAYIPSRKRSG